MRGLLPNYSPAGSQPRWHLLFLLIALPLGLVAVLCIPPMQALDGGPHLLRIDQIARGEFLSPLDAESRAVILPDRCLAGFISSHKARGWIPGAMSMRANFRKQPCESPKRVDISNTAINSPVAYLPQTVGYGVGRALGGVVVGFYLARLLGLLAYVALAWLALRIAGAAAPLLFVVALMPSALCLASVLSADGPTLGLALLCVALTARLRELGANPGAASPRSVRLCLVLLPIATALLVLSKNVYAVFVMLFLLVPISCFRSRTNWRKYVFTSLLAGAMVSAGWTLMVVSKVRLALPRFGIDSFATRRWAFEHPFAFGASLLRGLWDPWMFKHTLPGYVEVLGKDRPIFGSGIFNVGDAAPVWLICGAVALLALAFRAQVTQTATADSSSAREVPDGPAPEAHEECESRSRLAVFLSPRVVLPIIVLVSTTLIFVGVRLSSSPVKYHSTPWVQGRYFLPLTMLAVLVPSARSSEAGGLVRWWWVIPVGSVAMLLWVLWRGWVVFY